MADMVRAGNDKVKKYLNYHFLEVWGLENPRGIYAPNVGEIFVVNRPIEIRRDHVFCYGLYTEYLDIGTYVVDEIFGDNGYSLMRVNKIPGSTSLQFCFGYSRHKYCDWRSVTRYRPPAEISYPELLPVLHERTTCLIKEFSQMPVEVLAKQKPVVFWQIFAYSLLLKEKKLSAEDIRQNARERFPDYYNSRLILKAYSLIAVYSI
jgi:hypothetical protein